MKRDRKLVSSAIGMFILCGSGIAVAAGNIANTPERSSEVSITQIYGGGSLLLRGGQVGGESATVDSVRLCAAGVGKHGDVTNSPKTRGRTAIVGGRDVAV